MKYKELGRSGIQVSELCLGTMTFGDGADKSECRKLYATCRDRGINFIDTANVYADGESERILGKLIHEHRSDVIVATKAYYPTSNDINARGLSRKHLTHALHQSLRNLDTDYVDIFYFHSFDNRTSLHVGLATISNFVRDGKILYLGLSNFAAWQVMKTIHVASEFRNIQIACIQPMYNLLKRQCESELLPMAAAENLGVLTYGPIAGGFLTGKYLGARPVAGRFAESEAYRDRYADESNCETAERFTSLANELGVHPSSLAIAWVASNPIVTAPIIGARNVEQLDTALASLDIEMTDPLRQSITNLSMTPALATDRAEERE